MSNNKLNEKLFEAVENNMTANKPIPAVVCLELKNKNDSGEKFIGLSTAMYQNNLISGEPRELRRSLEHTDILELICTFTDKKTFNNWLKNGSIINSYGKIFKTMLKKNPYTREFRDVIIDVDDFKVCNCTKRDFFLLEGRSFPYMGGLYCENCLSPVPNYLIPKNIDLESWLVIYERIYQIWLDSSILEKQALKLLKDTGSELNKKGMELANEISVYFKLPVYFVFFSEEPDMQLHCPVCGGKGEDSLLSKPAEICRKCMTAFNYSR